MKPITLKQLLEAGSHFGHQVNRWHPKAKQFIYTKRDNIHIIDLAKTKRNLEIATEFIKEQASKGGKIIFVGTKRQAQKIVFEEAKRVGAMYMIKRWLGGLFTNWEQIEKNLNRLKKLEADLKNEEIRKKYTKYEVTLWQREFDKLMGLYGGIYDLNKIPEMLFIVDVKKEQSAVKEAIKKVVKIVAIVDTNTDPTLIDYPIPANDDAVGSIKLITSYIADAYKEGVEIFKKKETENQKSTRESKRMIANGRE